MAMIWVLLLIVVVGMGYIRLAPSVPSRWHVVPKVTEDVTMTGGVKRLIADGSTALGPLDAIIRATPRTQVLAGSVEDGMVTYVTRSRVIGFPDYTTVQQDGDTLKLWARLRFGRSDFRVNRDRVDQWLAQLRQVQTGGEG